MGRDILNDPALRRRKPRSDDKPAKVQAARKPSVFAKIKAGVQLARVINKARTEPMKNWKTTLGGILLAAGQFAPQFLPADYSWVGGTLSGIGALLLGKSAMDATGVKDSAKK